MTEKKKEIKQDLENLEQTAEQTAGQIDEQSDLENFEQTDEHQANGHKKEKKSEAKVEKDYSQYKDELFTISPNELSVKEKIKLSAAFLVGRADSEALAVDFKNSLTGIFPVEETGLGKKGYISFRLWDILIS